MEYSPPEQVYILHEKIQYILFKNIECNPVYPRSMSYIYIQKVQDHCLTPEEAFRRRFIYLLSDKMYNIDQPKDCHEITKAMLLAYKGTIDPLALKK